MSTISGRPLSSIDELIDQVRLSVSSIFGFGGAAPFAVEYGLQILADPTYGAERSGERWAGLLRDAIHPLILLGDYRFLNRPARAWARAIAGKLGQGSGGDGRGRLLSRLYKGIVEVANGELDLGFKNVELSWQQREDLDDEDRSFARWALASTAIQQRDLKLAYDLAMGWEAETREPFLKGRFRGAHCHAGLLCLFLELLFGDLGAARSRLLELEQQEVPGLWSPAARLLNMWFRALSSGADLAPLLADWTEKEDQARAEYLCALRLAGQADGQRQPSRSSVPLILGLDWCAWDAALQESGVPPSRSIQGGLRRQEREDSEPPPPPESAEFGVLCELRRRFRSDAAIEALSSGDLLRLSGWLARWNLERPLKQCWRRHRGLAPDAFYGFLLETQLGRYVAHDIMNTIDAEVERVCDPDDAVVFMMDIQKYSALSERVAKEPRKIFDVLTPVFKIMHEELEPIGGMVHEYIGDCIMVVFNVFDTGSVPAARPLDILRRSARCLRRNYLIATMLKLNIDHMLQFGIGIQKGPAAKAYLGSMERSHLAILGNTVNIAARLEAMTRDLPAPIAVTEEFFGERLPDLWAEPEAVNFSLRYLGPRTFKNVARPYQVFGVHSLVRFWVDFVPMGYVASPEPDVVYMDTGGQLCPGIIDNHFEVKTNLPYELAPSACEILIKNPGLLLDHLKIPESIAVPGTDKRRPLRRIDIEDRRIELRIHATPDLDCCASVYAAYELLTAEPRREVLAHLGAYVSEIDRGAIPDIDHLADSLYGVFQAHHHIQREKARKARRPIADLEVLELGLRVIDAAVFLAEYELARASKSGEELPPGPMLFSAIFARKPGWFPEERARLRGDEEDYRKKDRGAYPRTYKARVRGEDAPVTGLWLDHPQSLLFKYWARNDPEAPGGAGYGFTVVDWSIPQSNDFEGKKRFVISVDPDSGTDLEGLGALLEEREKERREHLDTKRPLNPPREGTGTADPWYFGWGRGYTIIDAPYVGTVLTDEEVQAIHENWNPE